MSKVRSPLSAENATVRLNQFIETLEDFRVMSQAKLEAKGKATKVEKPRVMGF